MTKIVNVPSLDGVEHIACEGGYLATIIRASVRVSQTTFVTPDSYYQQCGFVVYPKDGVVARHKHTPLERRLVGTPETIIVREGKMEVELYDFNDNYVTSVVLGSGDVILLAGGGHRMRCLEDTIMMEVKQGPYTGLKEKELF